MELVVDNLRLAELVTITRSNEPYYNAFVTFILKHGYKNIYQFINESNEAKALSVIVSYLDSDEKVKLHDGIGREYESELAKWYFLSWVMRDAPAQRLAPLLKNMKGTSTKERRGMILNEVRKFAAPLFPEEAAWTWPAIAEIMLTRLEGSRRSLKGTTFEDTVRTIIRAVIAKRKLKLVVGGKQVRISDETYDVQIIGQKRTILVPVKTRETMGGGHANLFTRDIHKAISVARENKYECIPAVSYTHLTLPTKRIV